MNTPDARDARSGLSMRIEGFRAFRDSGWFNLRTLTYLVGRNSSGKSSVLTALLLLKQTLDTPRRSRDFRIPLNLTGPFCELGQYSDAVYNHKTSTAICFSFRLQYPKDPPLQARSGRPLVEIESPSVLRLERDVLYPSFKPDQLPRSGDVSMKLTFSYDRQRGPALSEVRVDAGDLGFVVMRGSVSDRDFAYWHVYHTSLPLRLIEIHQKLNARLPRVSRARSYRNEPPAVRRQIRQFENAAAFIADSLESVLRMTDVVGPYRPPPDRHYSFSGLDTARNGVAGEQAVSMLLAERLIRPTRTQRSLNAAVSAWLKHLKLANEIKVQDLASRLRLYSLSVAGAGRRGRNSLADVGFGVSQVLPILVQGMLMRPGGIFLVQQPELHLHPDAQAGLADFFFYLGAQGVPCIIETHSEYLLLRLRRRLAEGKMHFPTLAGDRQPFRRIDRNDVSVLLTSPAASGGAGVTELTISKSLQFESLPKGFMTQALDDRLALLSALASND